MNDRRIAMIAGGLLAVVFTICSASSVAGWSVSRVERTTHRTIPGPVGSLTIDARSAGVTLIPSENGDVEISGHTSGNMRAPDLEVRPDGAQVHVEGGCPDITFGHCSADLIVHVPDGTAVRVEAGSGDITA